MLASLGFGFLAAKSLNILLGLQSVAEALFDFALHLQQMLFHCSLQVLFFRCNSELFLFQ